MDCGQLSFPFIRCDKHLKIRAEQSKKRRKNLKLQNRCYRCGIDLHSEMDAGFLTCLTCRDIMNDKSKQY